MMMERSKFKVQSLAFSVCAIIFLLFPLVTHAISISPARQMATVDAGKTQTVPLHVVNNEDVSLVLLPEVSAFVLDEENGSPIFDQESAATSWVSVEPAFLELEPGGDGEFLFTITVPENQEPGSHYLGLFARSSPPDGAQVGIGSRVGSLLFLHVAGVMYEDVVRTSFFIERGSVFDPQLRAHLALQNVGTIHVEPVGNVSLENSRAGRHGEQALNPNNKKILPDGTWQGVYDFDALSWKDIGKVDVVAEVTYGVSKKQMTDRVSFWYIPLDFFLLVAGGVIVIIGILFFVRRKKQ